MLFHELYGRYFHVVGEILEEAVQHRLTGSRLGEIVREKAFGESSLTIPSALEKDWPLLREDLSTPLRHAPSMPLTTLQKRWLKTLLEDERIRLFAPDPTGLEEVEPLFDGRDVVYFDQYGDGDPYGDAQYIQTFQTLMEAIGQHRSVQVTYCGAGGRSRTIHCGPVRMEYSEKDDKFRLLARKNGNRLTLNLSRIVDCTLLGPFAEEHCPQKGIRRRQLTLRLRDERDALDRALLHFSHLEKETVQLSDREYALTLWYDPEDETELLIRILSFGPMVQVVSPEGFVRRIRERLERQRAWINRGTEEEKNR